MRTVPNDAGCWMPRKAGKACRALSAGRCIVLADNLYIPRTLMGLLIATPCPLDLCPYALVSREIAKLARGSKSRVGLGHYATPLRRATWLSARQPDYCQGHPGP